MAGEEGSACAGEESWQLAGVALEHAGVAAGTVLARMGEVGDGEARPAALELDAERVSVEVDCFDRPLPRRLRAS